MALSNERTPLWPISIDAWAKQSEERLTLENIHAGEDYFMLSRIDAPSTTSGGQLVEAAASRVKVIEFDTTHTTTAYHKRGWHALKAVFLTDEGEYYSAVGGVIDSEHYFFPNRNLTPPLASRETGDIGTVAMSYFLAPSSTPLRTLDTPRVLHERRHPDSELVSL